MPPIDLQKLAEQRAKEAQAKCQNIVNLSTQLLVTGFERQVEFLTNMEEYVDYCQKTAKCHFDKIEQFLKEERKKFESGKQT